MRVLRFNRNSEMTVPDLARALNHASKDYRIGRLQYLRKEMHGLGTRPAGPIFSGDINNEWACHWGGRKELQFNIGLDEGRMRHGVAFSLETSLALPTIEPLVPKIARFNEFISTRAARLIGYEMWHWDVRTGYRSENGTPQPITTELVSVGNFIFLGKTQPLDAIDIHQILADFDHLLEIYFFTEDKDSVITAPVHTRYPEGIEESSAWQFRSGHTPYAKSQTATYTERVLDVMLRHNWLQTAIFNVLSLEFGSDYVGTEQHSLSNGEIDFVIRKNGWMAFAELKTSASVMSCIRDAIGQLLEYAYYGMEEEASELWVIGTGKCSASDRLYLEKLRSKLGIKIFYRRFDENLMILEPVV